jgi:hypothetical protein
MTFFKISKAMELVAGAASLDSVTKELMALIIDPDVARVANKYGIKFSPVEGNEFALTASVHRRIVDIEVQHAIWNPPGHQSSDKFLIGKVDLFLRGSGDERSEIECGYIFFSTGEFHMSSTHIDLDGDVALDHKIAIRDALSQIILLSVQEKLLRKDGWS